MPSVVSLALVLAVLVGGALQRVAGLGLAMVVAPVALLVLHGQQGVVFTNLFGAIAAAGLVAFVRADIEWKRFGLLAGASVTGAIVGAAVVSALDVAVFRIAVGILLIVAILASLFAGRIALRATGGSAAIVAGAVTGLLVTMSGIGGPPMTIYAVVSRWEHRAFVATMQPFIALISVIGGGAVFLTAPDASPQLPAATWLLCAVALVAGLLIGQVLSRVVSARLGRTIVIALGFIGATSAIISGAAALTGR